MEHGHCSTTNLSDKGFDACYNLLKRQTIFALIVGSILFIIYMFEIIPPINTNIGMIANIVVAIVSFITLLYSARHFFTGAFSAFLQHRATMNTLIAIGSGSAWVYSCLVLVFHDKLPLDAQHVYFEASIVIVGLVNFGSLLEMRARKKTSLAVNSLLNLQPKTARIVHNGSEEDVPVETIKVGDLIHVRAGEQIPVDGIITDGTSVLDESMLTGEPVPKTKVTGDKVTAGTLNQSGSFIFKATKIGQDTTLAKIAALIQNAQQSKPQLAKLADRISRIFVPLVIIIAICTMLAWFNFGPYPKYSYMLITTMSVLVIACPCALGLAVPMSVMIAIERAAQYGILIRDGDALTHMGNVTTVVLDKTGTLTLGLPKVVNVYPHNEFTEQDVLTIAAALEKNSTHPYAVAIEKATKDTDIKTLMITGDNYTTAKAVAQTVGIEEVISGVMPEEKVNKIIELQDEGDIVAMVGDGINDAPALASANVGIAIGSGSDIAIQSSDVTILGESLNNIIKAIALSKYATKNMHQNLFAAFFYNIVGIPIAAGLLFPLIGVLLNPMLASSAMALSSLTVVINANRLRFKKLVN